MRTASRWEIVVPTSADESIASLPASAQWEVYRALVALADGGFRGPISRVNLPDRSIYRVETGAVEITFSVDERHGAVVVISVGFDSGEQGHPS